MTAQATRVKWFMQHYGGLTPKPHYAWANTEVISRLETGGVKKRKLDDDQEPKIQTCVQYTNKDGKQCFHGTRQLRKTENLV